MPPFEYRVLNYLTYKSRDDDNNHFCQQTFEAQVTPSFEVTFSLLFYWKQLSSASIEDIRHFLNLSLILYEIWGDTHHIPVLRDTRSSRMISSLPWISRGIDCLVSIVRRRIRDSTLISSSSLISRIPFLGRRLLWLLSSSLEVVSHLSFVSYRWQAILICLLMYLLVYSFLASWCLSQVSIMWGLLMEPTKSIPDIHSMILFLVMITRYVV